MNHEERKAFIDAYDDLVCMCSKKETERIVKDYFSGKEFSDFERVEHVIDFMMIWMAATVYQMEKDKELK